VRVTQTGEMWRKPGAKPLRFRATEDFAIDEVAFAWRARFPLLGPVALDVVDELREAAGRLRVTLLGIPLQTETGAETAIGQAMRYLAELAWVPQAVAGNRELEWQQTGERSLEVATYVGPARAAVQLELDEAGDIVRATGMRPRRGSDGIFRPTPWGGDFSRHTRFGETRLPADAETWWELPEGRFVYWRGRVTRVDEASS
jgi:hypothetical protein